MTIVVGGRELLAPLHTRPEITSGGVSVFPTDDIRAALESIIDVRPQYLVLDDEFSKSPRGTAMIERLHADTAFEATEVLLVHGTQVTTLHAAVDNTTAASLDWRGTRRVPRIRVRSGVEVQLDGTIAQLVDLSTLGAQVVSTVSLKPNQRVRFNLPADAGGRMIATVAWVNFELPKGKPTPQYRAGLEFSNPDPRPLEQFCVSFAFVEVDPRR